MKRTTWAGAFGAGLLAALATPTGLGAQTAISAQEARAIAVDAYLYLYPLVTMDITRSSSPTSSLARNSAVAR